MGKYGVTIIYSESRYIEVEANSEHEAEDIAYERMDDAEPFGGDDYEFEVEELENE